VSSTSELLAAVMLPLGLLLLVLVVLWIVLPFAVFGIKARLHRLEAGQEQTNRLLQQIVDLQSRRNN
jgi:biopolymer transport protein ExbB/TolQ